MALTLNGSTGLSGIVGSAGTPALQGTDTNTGYFFGTDTLGLSTAGSESFRIDSSGRLLKSGQTALTSTSLNHPIQVTADAEAQNICIIGRAADDIGEISFYEADKSTRLGELQYRQDHLNFRHRVGYMSFCTGGATERLRIDSNGNVSIHSGAYDGGNTVPQLYVRGTSGRQVKIHNPDAGTCSLQLSNSTTGQGEDNGFQLAQLGGGDFHFDHQLQAKDIVFRTKPSGGSVTERLRIDSSGNLWLNGNGSYNTDRQVFNADGTSGLVEATNELNIFQNKSSSGGLYIGYKDIANGGTITDYHFYTGQGNDTKANISCEYLMTKGVDFGVTSHGGGMTSEVLDDYEEGTWTTTQLGAGGGVPLTNNVCYYTKIGNICHVHGMIDVGATSGTSVVHFSLPFTSKADSGSNRARNTFALMHKFCNVHDSYINIVGYIGQNEAYWRIYNVGDNIDWHQFLSGDFTADSGEILFSVSYMTS